MDLLLTNEERTTSSHLEVWANQDNRKYYESVNITDLQNACIRSGLDNNMDLKLLYRQLTAARSILEIGAGYGRVLQFLGEQNYPGKITAIEHCTKFYQYLEKHYHNTATLYHSNIQDFHSNENYDVILWLWCGIIDFSHHEQLEMIKKIKSYLNVNGSIIIDTILLPDEFQQNAYKRAQVREESKGILYRYLPAEFEIETYAKAAGLQIIDCLIYEPPAAIQLARKKGLYILAEH